MNLYEKIGRLIKHNKIFDISNNSNNNPNQNETSIGLELEQFESILSEILSPLKSEIQSPITNFTLKNNKVISKSDIEEAQKLIKTCSQDQQLILIAILEIQISLGGNENNYIKYEKLTEKIIEKNIYWVISYEIHTRIHKTKIESKEYCHYFKDKRSENIFSKGKNFRYDNIDSIICQLKCKNKKIEYIAIKSIVISFYNFTCELVEKYLEIMDYKKKNNKPNSEYVIFNYIINDYAYIIEKIKFINTDFKQSINDFININNISNFSMENLFKEIFFNIIFHNQILGFQYIQGFIHSDSETKQLFIRIIDLVGSIKNPIMKDIVKILNLDGIINYKIDLISKIMEQNEQMHICVGVGKCEIKNDDEEEEIIGKKEIIYIRGKIGKKEKDKNDDDFDMDKIIIGINKDKNSDEDNDEDEIIEQKIIINKNIITKNKQKIESEIEGKEEDTKIINDIKENNTDKIINIDNESNKNNSINFNEIKENNDNKEKDINKSKFDLKDDKINMDEKSLDEICEYINKDNKVKGKKKNKRRNKAKLKKNKCKNEVSESTMDDSEDPVVIQFKNDIKECFINANTITKIKPLISDNFIKRITSY